MKNLMYRLDPVVMGIIGAVMLITGVIVLGITIASVEDKFVDKCKNMGGTPLIAHSGTKICFKSDFVLQMN